MCRFGGAVDRLPGEAYISSHGEWNTAKKGAAVRSRFTIIDFFTISMVVGFAIGKLF